MSTHYHGKFSLLTFYHFVDIADPQGEVKKHYQFTHDLGLKGRIYIGEEGISATVSGNEWQLWAYRQYLLQNPYFAHIADIDEKASTVAGHAFDKMIVRYRQEIVALGKTITAAQVQQSLQEISPDDLKKVIDTNNDDYVILDMRNSYEYKLGHFKNAIPAGTINFREMQDLIKQYKEKLADKKVVMYCTGGIRCDKLSVLLKEEWLNNFYALNGGVVKYVHSHNDGNRLGNLYTFDGLISTKVGDAETHTTIGHCIYTWLMTDHCENCRYSPCNARILCRRKQYKRFGGFCSAECFEQAKIDGLVKNESFDSMDYKDLRSQVKSGKMKEADFLTQVQAHLDKIVVDKKFPCATSQKEEIVDKELLEQYWRV